ncbi:MAG: VOC family protein [Dehalococcoidia bacterium]|nr:VOC family protein [Dehalococcoidia bacterium]
MQVSGIGYPAIIVKNVEESIAFYQRAFGLELLYLEPNRDDPESVQAMLRVSDDACILLIGPVDPNLKLAEASLGVGSTQYLALRVDAATLDRAFFEFSNSGIRGSEEIRRGYERLVFLEDPNGVLLIVTAWITEPPAGIARTEVLRRAAALREADRSPFIEDQHIQRAIAELQG